MAAAALLAAAVGAGWLMRERILNALLFYPARTVDATPDALGLDYRAMTFLTDDGETLHGFWVPAPRETARGHVLLCHGNAGTIADRLEYARLLGAVGLDVLLFDYRGYGMSTGAPSEHGTYRDARAALRVLRAQPEVDPARIVYLGESLGGAVAIALAAETPPRALILQSTFTNVRAIGRHHYPFVPSAIVPDAYPSLARIARVEVPTLVIHGDRDQIVPVEHGRALHAAAAGPKRLDIYPGIGHNDLVDAAGWRYAASLTSWLDAIDEQVSAGSDARQ